MKQRLRDQLRDDDRVVGVGIGIIGGDIVVRVNVVDADDVPDLPGQIDGVPLYVHAVGRVRPQA